MSFLTQNLAILILKVLNINDYPKCRREIAASLNDYSSRWCKRENVEHDALKECKINIFKLLILVFHFTLVTHIFYPQNLNLLFVTLSEVSRIFI